MDRYFIRNPGPGEYRGEGPWVEIDPKNPQQLKYWAWCKETGHLPAGRTCAARDVRDEKGKRPNFVVEGEELFHQFAGFAVCLPKGYGPQAMLYCQKQLLALVEQHTEVGHVTEKT